METKTTLSEEIAITEGKSRYDAACKQLLAEKIVLAWIMQSCVEEFRDIDVKEIAGKYIEGEPKISKIPVRPDEVEPESDDEQPSKVKGTATEDASVNEGTITYDIRFDAVAPQSDGMISLILNVEAQNKFNPSYPLIKRGIYYCSRMISAQYGTEFVDSHYEKIKKVYSIWVCMDPPVDRQNSITTYKISENNLIGRVEEEKKKYDLLTVVMICLGKPGDKNYDGVLKLLEVLLSNETKADEKRRVLQEDFGIPMTRTLERKVDVMCNLSEGVWEKGVQQGIQQGVQQGIQQGIQQGTQQMLLENLKSVMASLKCDAQRAMDVLNVPSSDRSMYAAQLPK